MIDYDVIIVGGGPTGAALGIELGLNGIKTLILEKHETPLLSPRAQSLNPRSMEFFRRWQLANTLKAKQLLPPDFPIRGIWCSKLNGTVYATSSSNDQLTDEISPERGIRIPLWITEAVLREKLAQLSTVTFLKQHEVVDVAVSSDSVIVTAHTARNNVKNFRAKYVVGCDGANSITRKKVGIEFEVLAPPRRVINVMFESQSLEKLVTVDKGFLFYLLDSQNPGAIGPVDLTRGLWYVQIRDNDNAETIDQVDVSSLLDQMVGFSFEKKVVQAHFWQMHIQLARHFSDNDRVFLVGDSAHAFVPTGGFGLNTGLGDVVNVGWKLAAVIKEKAHPALLKTYEQERRAICLQNLNAAQKNADDMMALRKKYNPSEDPVGFAKANAALAKQHTYSLGLTMGYGYFVSPLTILEKGQCTQSMAAMVYQPTVAPGYFLPHCWVDEKQSIYDVLSPVAWTLIIPIDQKSAYAEDVSALFKKHRLSLEIRHCDNPVYLGKYLLVRPDWHIALISNHLSLAVVESYLSGRSTLFT